MKQDDEYVLPHLINCVCGQREIESQRAEIVPLAHGKVSKIGIDSRLTLKHYGSRKVNTVWGLKSSVSMRRKAKANLARSEVPVEWLDLPSEVIPLDDGELVFSEHGESPDADIRTWQKRVNPVWKKLAGGCNLNRPTPSLISSAGFTISEVNQCYLKDSKVASYQYYGGAHPNA